MGPDNVQFVTLISNIIIVNISFFSAVVKYVSYLGKNENMHDERKFLSTGRPALLETLNWT